MGKKIIAVKYWTEYFWLILKAHLSPFMLHLWIVVDKLHPNAWGKEEAVETSVFHARWQQGEQIVAVVGVVF